MTATGAIEHSKIPGAEGQGFNEEEDDGDADEGFGGNRTHDRSIRNTAKTQEELDAELDWDL